jgi:hypothetical protein
MLKTSVNTDVQFVFALFLVGSTVLRFEHLVLISHAFYHLSNASSPFPFSCFSGRVLCFYLGHHNPPTSTSFVAGIIGVLHHTQLGFLDKVLLIFSFLLALNHNLPISDS